MTAALVRDNWTGVGKKELENDPISGTIGKLLDTAFIDREDPQSAVESLHKIEELARRGLSVLVAPEGTRVKTAEVGLFKKGPFRIAMSAGIPIVPIVIRNAEHVAPRDASTLNPGTVDIAVFPPIPTADWTIRTLPRRIAAVRKLYVDTMADWPDDDVVFADRAKSGRRARQKATSTTRPKEPS
jgi:putative phosphoserine phosphatase/1-acylglycerol-3-phosphate O-acyltransferase